MELSNESQAIDLSLKNIRIHGNSTLTILVSIGQADIYEVSFAGTLNYITIGYSLKESKFDYLDF